MASSRSPHKKIFILPCPKKTRPNTSWSALSFSSYTESPRRSKQKSFFEYLGKWNARAYRFFFLLYFTFTVKAKTTVDNDTDSHPTGDNSHMTLWIALLEASVFGLSGTAVCSKRKRAR